MTFVDGNVIWNGKSNRWYAILRARKKSPSTVKRRWRPLKVAVGLSAILLAIQNNLIEWRRKKWKWPPNEVTNTPNHYSWPGNSAPLSSNANLTVHERNFYAICHSAVCQQRLMGAKSDFMFESIENSRALRVASMSLVNSHFDTVFRQPTNMIDSDH